MRPSKAKAAVGDRRTHATTVSASNEPLEPSSQSTRRALIVEDLPEFQTALSDAIAALEGNWTVNCFSFGRDAIAFAESCKSDPHIVFIDLGLPDVEGILVVKAMRERFPETPILIVSVLRNEEYFIKALKYGANGYVLKDDDSISISTSIDQVLKGWSPISPFLARCLIRVLDDNQDIAVETTVHLSRREKELLDHIAKGRSYPEAAAAMGLKTITVYSYSRSLFRKLGARSKMQAVLLARRQGVMVL